MDHARRQSRQVPVPMPEQNGGSTQSIRKHEACSEPIHSTPHCFRFDPIIGLMRLIRALVHAAHFGDTSNIIENIRQTRRLEVYHFRRPESLCEPRHSAERQHIHRTIVGQITSAQLAQQRLIDGVKSCRSRQRAATNASTSRLIRPASWTNNG